MRGRPFGVRRQVAEAAMTSLDSKLCRAGGKENVRQTQSWVVWGEGKSGLGEAGGRNLESVRTCSQENVNSLRVSICIVIRGGGGEQITTSSSPAKSVLPAGTVKPRVPSAKAAAATPPAEKK
eukprot:scaffold121752_cov29-Tisochrysis_lutea.AAC.9